jgi:hypothetical protein
MTIQEAVYQWRTYVPVLFERAVTGPPILDAPDLDNRSFRGPEHGPVVGIMAGETVRVALRRTNLDGSAVLFVTSSDPQVVTATGLASGRLPSGDRIVFHLQAGAAGVSSPSTRTARILVHFGAVGGPVLGALTVINCSSRSVDLTPHFVTIGGAAGEPRGPDAATQFTAILNMVQAIWRPCGIVFNAATPQSDAVTFARAGEVDQRELNRLLNTNWNQRTINVYFVHLMRVAGSPDFLGVGISPDRKAEVGVTKPGIILADTNVTGDRRDAQYWANDLAHEIGHFLSLHHAGDRSTPNELHDPWARRMLMYPRNTQDHAPAPLAYRSNVGYGELDGWHHRGCLLTMKNVPGVPRDGECTSARQTIDAGSSIYGP